MSIYATNRSGSASSATIVANEAYKSNDIGRILYESTVNDQRIFEAILASDLHECQALNEGTLLESEIAALNEASAKEFFEQMLLRVKGFWSKIKNAFSTIIQKISAYALKDGKAFVKEFNAVYDLYKEKTKKSEYSNSNADEFDIYDLENLTIVDTAEMAKIINTRKDLETSLAKKEIVSEILRMTIPSSSDLNASNYKETVFEKLKKQDSIKNGKKIKDYCDFLSNASTMIKDIIIKRKETDKVLDRLCKSLKDEERKAKDDPSKVIKRISILVSACETVVALETKVSIAMVKANAKTARSALGVVMAGLKEAIKEAKLTKNEAATFAEDEVDLALDDADVDNSDIIDEINEAISMAEYKYC